MGAGSEAAQVFGGLFASLWLASAACVALALWRLRQFALTSSLLHAYKRLKGGFLAMLLGWCAVKLLADWWWAVPRAYPERSIVVAVLVEGLFRTSVFALIILYWRMPLSTFLVNRGMLRSRHPAALAPERIAPEPTSTIVQMPTLPQRGHRRAESAAPLRGLQAEPRLRRGSLGSVEMAEAVAARDAAAHEDGGDGAEWSPPISRRTDNGHARTKSAGNVSAAAEHYAIPAPAVVDKRLSEAVASKAWGFLPVLVVIIGVILHVSFAIVQSRATASAGGLRWCVASQSTGLNMCVVPIEGSSREEIMLLAQRELDADATVAPTTLPLATPATAGTGAGPNGTNASWVPVSTAPAPTEAVLERVVVDSGFDATPVLVVQARVVTIVIFATKAVVAAMWFVISREHAKTIINRTATERFRVFRILSSAMCLTTMAAEFTMLFDGVRSTGWAFTMSLLVANGADAIIVAMIALRAAKLKDASELCPSLRQDGGNRASDNHGATAGPLSRLTRRMSAR